MNAAIQTLLLASLFGWLIVAIPLPIITGILLDYRTARIPYAR